MVRLKRLVPVVFALAFVHFSHIALAQVSTPVSCGTSQESGFTRNDETQDYQIHMDAGSRLFAYVEKADQFGNMKLKIGIFTANGDVVENFERYNYRLFKVASTPTLQSEGTFIVSVRGSAPGTYRLFVDCVDADGAVVSAGNITHTASCGSIVPNSFSQAQAREDAVHHYFISLLGVNNLTASVEVADTRSDLGLKIALYDPDGNVLHQFKRYDYIPVDTAEVEFPSKQGVYTVLVLGATNAISEDYNLYISCILLDGTRVNPGDPLADNQPTREFTELPTDFVGFPGLAPSDFASAVKLPLIPATPMAGAITPNGGEILGFQIDASAGDVLDLSLNRLSGNLNLGLVVLSSSNEVVSYGGLITGDTLSTRLTLPSAGQYTIGVFRVDLLPPADPQATAFQVTGTLNP